MNTKETKDRDILKNYLKNLSLYDLADILTTSDLEKKGIELLVAEYMAKNLSIVEVRNIIAEEIGYEEYEKLCKKYK